MNCIARQCYLKHCKRGILRAQRMLSVLCDTVIGRDGFFLVVFLALSSRIRLARDGRRPLSGDTAAGVGSRVRAF